MMKTPTYKHARHTLTAMLGGLLASFLCISGLVNAQEAEVEPNDTGVTAQGLCIPAGGLVINATMGGTDLDLFWFDATAGDVPFIMINSDQSTGTGDLDTLLVLYDAAGQVLNQNDDPEDWLMNPGSTTLSDSRLEGFALGASGRYIVAVTPIPRYIGTGFTQTMEGLTGGSGNYALHISGITAPLVASPDSLCGSGDVATEPTDLPGDVVKAITIEVRHWSGSDRNVSKRWKRRMKRMGKRRGIHPVPVVMMSSDGFDAMSIDENSLTFGRTGEEDSLFRCSKRARDINKDGMKDKMCFFDAFKTDFGVGDVQGLLAGMTIDGQEFKSSATLKVYEISKKKKKRKGRHHHNRHDDDSDDRYDDDDSDDDDDDDD